MIRVSRLIWDDLNIAHIARHEVSPDEVAEVCRGEALVQEGHSGRVVLIGATASARILEVVLAHRGEGVYYVVTAHTASRRDRALYQAERLGGDEGAHQ